MDVPIPATWEEAATMIVPAVRRATEPAHAFRAERDDPANRLVRRPFAPFLAELVMLDLPDVRLFLNRGHLDRWGVDAQTAFAAAHEVLKDHATAGLRYNDTYGLWQLDAPDGAATSRLVLDGWLRAFEGQVAGKPVAIAPWRRLLMVGGLDDDEQLGRMIDIADQGWRRAPSPTTPALYTVDDDGKTVPLRVSPVSKRHLRIEAAHRVLARDVYEQQREIVSPHASAPLAEVFLEHASDSGEARTWSRWSHETPEVWLPETDFVELVTDGGTAWLPWDRFRTLAAASLVPLELHPVRYRTEWPKLKALYALLAATDHRG